MDPPAITTDSLLAEIPSESLQSCLTSLRLDASFACNTGIPCIDSHLQPTSSHTGVLPGDIIELQGPSSSGKSHLVYHLVATCVSPSLRPQSNGWGKAAAIFDMDHTFDIRRFRRILERHLSDLFSLENAAEEDTNGPHEQLNVLLDRCMRHLHIFRPDSTLQLAFSLFNLPHYHANHPAMQDQELGLIAVDAINAFYWTDRFTMEQLRGGSLDFNVSTPLFHVATAFQRLRLSHAPVIVITTRDLVAASKNINVEGVPVIPSSRQHLYPFLIPAVKISGPSHAVGPDVTMTGTLSEVDVKPVLRKVPARPQNEVHLPLAFHIKLHPTSTMCIPIASVVGTRLEAGAHVEEGSVLVRGPTGLSIGTFSLSILPDKVLISPGAG